MRAQNTACNDTRFSLKAVRPTLTRMKIYTKTGDDGQTGLYGGARVSKACTRVASYGSIDEANSFLGECVLRLHDLAAHCRAPIVHDAHELILTIQSQLLEIGHELATPPGVDRKSEGVTDADILALEKAMDACEKQLPPVRRFLLPGGCPAAVSLHIARSVVRRAERQLVALSDAEPVRREVLIYVNRLSDLLFMLARLANHAAGVDETEWRAKEPK
jgi:cob(I)alamin adenosyltransferase